ncbi:MAG: 4-(cytidine 5'-diphospho)-2-C-methyl-D-erythritol kinase [Aliivibrio sp.]|uniref:4-(cytidine 5'-diphospho)-2-C-methyl-D-erythritol kinase n=1 Tax=Aliivibrio sp. TaxID=1872443 RepID=UPI001A5A248D|nr:4-(cytidine 5'-diphospho)-2-C-methyl-D-erythritol kinase [Aliivibrio sp.]
MSELSPYLGSTVWPAPAKLNLFLYITGQKENGYHELQTLFQFLDRCDQLTITANTSGKVTILPAIEGVSTEQNLIWKAATLLQQHSDCQFGADIELDKILPMGGGLGGGSSDAATTLVALNLLWGLNLSVDTLASLGLTLGADVPVFVRQTAAFAEGIGEKTVPAQPEEKWYLVIKPKVSISTVDIFTHPQLTRNTPKRSLQQLLNEKYENDCEKIVRSIHPEVDHLLSWLLEYAPSRLTGTGACIFAEFSSKQAATELFQSLPDHVDGFIAQGVNTSPLQLAVKRYINQSNN